MRNNVVLICLVLSGISCTAPDKIAMPSPQSLPIDWTSLSMSTIPGTDCLRIEGTYLEPPSIFRSGAEAKNLPKDNLDLYSSYIPFHRADRKELVLEVQDIHRNSFTIRQPKADEFFLLYFAEHLNLLIEYHFLSDEGDFECNDGYIEFPHFTIYGMIEGASVNFQIRNILLKDETGALIIQSTRGPYRGNASKATKKFMFEFIKYPPK